MEIESQYFAVEQDGQWGSICWLLSPDDEENLFLRLQENLPASLAEEKSLQGETAQPGGEALVPYPVTGASNV